MRSPSENWQYPKDVFIQAVSRDELTGLAAPFVFTLARSPEWFLMSPVFQRMEKQGVEFGVREEVGQRLPRGERERY